MLEPHWETLKTFVRSLMIGADWHGLHVIVISDSPILADATTVLAGTWGLPPAQVHAVSALATPDELVEQRCNDSSPASQELRFTLESMPLVKQQVYRGRRPTMAETTALHLRSYFAQWSKMDACAPVIQRIEARARAPFRFVVKMRPDYPFRRGPALASLQDEKVMYSRWRCADSHAVPRSYRSYQTHSIKGAVFSTGPDPVVDSEQQGCAQSRREAGYWPGTPASILDDMFVVAPRKLAAIFLLNAGSLPCPVSDARVLALVNSSQCGGRAWAECWFTAHVAMQMRVPRVGGSFVGPIPVMWGTQGGVSGNPVHGVLGWGGYGRGFPLVDQWPGPPD